MSELCVIVDITGGDICVVVYDIHYVQKCNKNINATFYIMYLRYWTMRIIIIYLFFNIENVFEIINIEGDKYIS